MKREITRVVMDTYAWVEFFTGGPRSRLVEEILTSVDEVYTPGIVMAELARKYVREGVDVETVRERLTVIEKASVIVDVDVETAVEAAKAYMELLERSRRERLAKPSLADAIVLAHTRLLRARLVTGDQHFRGLPETIWIGGRGGEKTPGPGGDQG